MGAARVVWRVPVGPAGPAWEAARRRLDGAAPSRHWLAPRLWAPPGGLGGGAEARASTSVRAALLPFWEFEAAASYRFSAMLGRPGGLGHVEWTPTAGFSPWRRRAWAWAPHPAQPTDEKAEAERSPAGLHVYASYKYRPDLAEGARVAAGAAGPRAEPVAFDLGGAPPDGFAADRPAMRQAVAWALALSKIRAEIRAEAEAELKAAHGCDWVKHIAVDLVVHRRQARCVFYPAYVVAYEYGTWLNNAQEIVPERHQALVGMAEGSRVLLADHFSPAKAQVVAAGAAGGAGLLLDGALSLGVGWDSLAVGTFLAAMGAGIAARGTTRATRRRAYEQEVEGEEAVADDWLEGREQAGLDPRFSIKNLSDKEWARWAHSDKWNWKEADRRKWAESMWSRQHQRELDVREHFRRLAEETRLWEEQVKREGKRSKQRGPGAAAGRAPNGWRQHDFLGYFKILGLEDTGFDITDEDIKTSFHREAKQWHPDKHRNDREKKAAADRFKKIQAAYQTLKDADSRGKYRRGELHAL